MDENIPTKTLLTVEAIGLLITATLLLVIATCLHLLARLFTGGQLRVDLTLLAYGFLFYVWSGFVRAGTRRRPDHAPFLLAHILFHTLFLSLGWLLFRAHVPLRWLGGAVACNVVIASGCYLFARLRRRRVAGLIQEGFARPHQLVERGFFVSSFVYRAIPLGAAAGLVLGALRGDAGLLLAWHALAGVFAVLATSELIQMAAGARFLASDFIELGAHARVQVGVVDRDDSYFVQVRAPSLSKAPDVALQTAKAGAWVRATCGLGQLERLMIAGFSLLIVRQLELSQLPWEAVACALLTAHLVLTVAPAVLGQHKLNVRVRSQAGGNASHGAAHRLPSALAATPWLALALSLALAAAAYLCLQPLLGAPLL